MATGRNGPLTAIAAIALAIGTLGGCAQAVSGTAQPNKAESDKAMAAAHDRGIKAFRGHFDSIKDEKGKLYNYLRFGSKSRDREFETAIQGNPPSLLFKQHDSDPNDSYDEFHPAGSDVNYLRLGDKHAHLAPTRWVSLPTTYPTKLGSCDSIVGFAACHLEKAIAQTKLDAPDRQPRQARAGDGIVEISSGITLGTAIDENLVIPPEDIAKSITPEMKAKILPVRIELGADGEFRKFEIRASVAEGSTTLEVQFGYEVTGKAEKKDLPSVPANEVTALTDKAVIDKFMDDLLNDR